MSPNAASCGQIPRTTAAPPRISVGAEKNREAPALTDTLGALFGVSQILPAAIREDVAYHQSQEQES
jgi:hypothetical protein